MEKIEVSFPERTIAQTITVLRSFCRTRGKVPIVVALVEGSSAEAVAWRKVAVDYLTAKANGRKVNPTGILATEGEDDDS